MNRTIVCAPKNYDELVKRYPKRNIELSSYTTNDWFIVMRANQKGIFAVRMSDYTVWVYSEYPYFKKRK